MDDINNDQIPAKVNEDVKYITVNEGIYKGVAYRINNAKFEEHDGNHYLAFDYDVNGLDEGKEDDFEKYLGEFLINALKCTIKEDDISGGDGR